MDTGNLLLYTIAMETLTDTPISPVDQSIDWDKETDDPTLSYVERGTLLKQSQFLEAFVKLGNIYESAVDSKVSTRTVGRWRSVDHLGFRDKFTNAHDHYIDRIEGRMRALAEEGRSYQAIKAILDAGRPAVWRDRSTLDTGTADLLSKLAAQSVAPARKAGEQMEWVEIAPNPGVVHRIPPEQQSTDS